MTSTQHQGVRTKPGWLGVRIMCPSVETLVDCCVSGWSIRVVEGMDKWVNDF